jgi:adenylate kinase
MFLREKPNFLITGTPGVGKSTFSSMLAARFGFVHIPVSQLIQEKHLWDERDEVRDCTIYNEDLLDDEIDLILENNPLGGVIFDFHSPDIVSTDEVDFVIVLQCESDILWQRLASRGYSEQKVRENVEAEIHQILMREVVDDYPEGMIIDILSNTMQDLAQGIAKVEQLILRHADE